MVFKKHTVMKQVKQSLRMALCFVLLCMAADGVRAQQQGFQWGKYFVGNPPIGNTSRDQILSSVMDSVGNIYVFGQFEESARINGEYICPMDSVAADSGYYISSVTGVFLAKFDSLGNTLWKKSVRAMANSSVQPWNMVIVDNRITVGVEVYTSSTVWRNADWLYLWDTLLFDTRSGAHAFPFDTTTDFITTFDLDGNLLENHFLRLYAFGNQDEHEWYSYKPRYFIGRLTVDHDRNIHIVDGTYSYWGDSLHIPTLVIDGDADKRYPLDFSYWDSNYRRPISTASYYKIDSNWNLVVQRKLMDHIVGYDKKPISLRFQNIQTDGDDLYVNGYMSGGMSADSSCTFPCYLYFDSVHYMKIEDEKGWSLYPFWAKLDNNGNILWLKQIYEEDNYFVNYFSLILDDTDRGYFACELSTVFGNSYLDSLHLVQIPVGQDANIVIFEFDKENGEIISFFTLDTNKYRTDFTTNMFLDEHTIIIASQCYAVRQEYRRVTYLYYIDRETFGTIKKFPVKDVEPDNIAINSYGQIFWAGKGAMTYIDDTVFLGNYDNSALMMFYYDTALDTRPRPCPPVAAPSVTSVEGRTVTLGWMPTAVHQRYELAYVPEGSDWDAATVIATTDTTATVTLPDAGCHLFRLRGLCPTTRHRQYGPWSDSVAACPIVGVRTVAEPGAFTLSPNPATSEVAVHGPADRLRAMTIVDMTGRTVATLPAATTIDLAPFAEGSYLVKFLLLDGTEQHVRLVRMEN